jgi:hypothetical protein
VALFESSGTATSVTNSATQIFTPSGYTSPAGFTVLNQGTAVVYVGGGTVTTTSGVPLAVGQQLTVSGPASLIPWAITASGTATVVAGLATLNAVV